VLWDGCEQSGRGMTLGEIVAQLADTSSWSNTTIRTLIIRLSEKGAVSIDKTTGVYKYIPNTSRNDCVRSEVDCFIDRVFAGSAYNLMASLVKEGKFSDGERQEIIRILKDIEEE
jgi:BlaI family penicillinase repressor